MPTDTPSDLTLVRAASSWRKSSPPACFACCDSDRWTPAKIPRKLPPQTLMARPRRGSMCPGVNACEPQRASRPGVVTTSPALATTTLF